MERSAMSPYRALLATLAFLFISGCVSDDHVDSSDWSPEHQVRHNTQAVQDAAQAFAAENDGLYPENTNQDQSLAGHTLIDLLPERIPLVNPYTGCRDQPVDDGLLRREKQGTGGTSTGTKVSSRGRDSS
jgi:hypothetical protein